MLAIALCEASLAPPRKTPSRRSIIAAAPAIATALPAFAVKETGYAANALSASEQGAAQRFADSPQGEPAGIRFAGSYSDPNHPGCPRKVKLAGKNAVIIGSDEDGKAWKVKAEVSGRRLLIDFTPKGGPADVVATWTGLGLSFPDGNVWTKV